MRRIVRVLAILTVLGLGIAGWIRQSPPEPTIKAPTAHYHGYELNKLAISKAKRFTVLISSEGFEGVGRGTGVLIDPTHVLTCAHMVQGPHDDLWVFSYPTLLVAKGSPVAVSRKDDLAVLELSMPLGNTTDYATFQEEHYDGEPITLIGNTKGAMRWFVTFGIVSGEWQGYIMTDGVLYGGNSGGPWINEKGEILAITDFTIINRDGTRSDIHGGVAASTINRFLKQWREPSILSIILG